ncbi:MAG: DUF4340 domain-containing protein, partial [Planctomycetota bacterium]
MKTKTTIILLIIAILIAGYIFFIDKGMPTSDERQQAEKKVFGFLKTDDISKIEINAPNAAQLTLVGSMTPTTPSRIAIICTRTADKEWLMTQPVNTRADRSVLDNIAGQIAGLEKKETLKETAKLEPYGLDYPTISLSFSAKGKDYLVKLGRAAPLNIGVYAAVEGRKDIYVVQQSFADSINKPVADFRHRRIFDASTYEMANLKFIYPDKTIELQKAGTDWQITQPVTDKTDQNKVRDLLSQIGTLSVSTFVADNETDLALYGLDKPALKLVAPDPKGSGKTETLLVGREREKDRLVATKEGTQTIFTIEKSSYDAIALPLDALRNKKAFNLIASDINKIEIKSGGKTAALLDKNSKSAEGGSPPDGRAGASGGKWQFVYPAMTVTNQAPAEVDAFIDKLNTYQIEQFTADTTTDLSAFALGEPFAGIEIILGFASGASEDRTLLGVAKNMPYVYMKKPDNPRVVALSNSLYEYLKQGSILFRKKSLVDVNSDKVKKISIAMGNDVSTFEQTKHQEWTITSPEQKKVEKNSELNTVMLEFCHLSASEFVADLNFSPDLIAYGLDKPEAIVTLEWSKDNSET